MAMFLADFPDTCSLQAINRLGSSGLQSLVTIANAITSHQIDFGIGGGVESLSLFDPDKLVDHKLLSRDVF